LSEETGQIRTAFVESASIMVLAEWGENGERGKRQQLRKSGSHWYGRLYGHLQVVSPDEMKERRYVHNQLPDGGPGAGIFIDRPAVLPCKVDQAMDPELTRHAR
jgi:hypothetical protein